MRREREVLVLEGERREGVQKLALRRLGDGRRRRARRGAQSAVVVVVVVVVVRVRGRPASSQSESKPASRLASATSAAISSASRSDWRMPASRDRPRLAMDARSDASPASASGGGGGRRSSSSSSGSRGWIGARRTSSPRTTISSSDAFESDPPGSASSSSSCSYRAPRRVRGRFRLERGLVVTAETARVRGRRVRARGALARRGRERSAGSTKPPPRSFAGDRAGRRAAGPRRRRARSRRSRASPPRPSSRPARRQEVRFRDVHARLERGAPWAPPRRARGARTRSETTRRAPGRHRRPSSSPPRRRVGRGRAVQKSLTAEVPTFSRRLEHPRVESMPGERRVGETSRPRGRRFPKVATPPLLHVLFFSPSPLAHRAPRHFASRPQT